MNRSILQQWRCRLLFGRFSVRISVWISDLNCLYFIWYFCNNTCYCLPYNITLSFFFFFFFFLIHYLLIILLFDGVETDISQRRKTKNKNVRSLKERCWITLNWCWVIVILGFLLTLHVSPRPQHGRGLRCLPARTLKKSFGAGLTFRQLEIHFSWLAEFHLWLTWQCCR
jgi:hypothetical protein